MRQNPYFCTFWLQNVLLATVACNFSTSELQKVLRACSVLYILTSQLQKVLRACSVLHIFTWKCASRHRGVQFLNISTSKSAPSMQCFVHFYFKMCFSPQRRAIFEHLNFKKWSEPDMFCTFSLQNVLLATAACNFSTSQLQKVVRSWCVLYIFTSKCASRHSGVQFLISPLTTWLRTRRFNEPTFRLTRHTNHWKNAAFRDFSNIWRGESSFFWLSHYCIFFLLTLLHLLTLLSSHFTSSICFSSAFQLSILSEVYYLNFLRWFSWICVPFVGVVRKASDGSGGKCSACGRKGANQAVTGHCKKWRSGSTPLVVLAAKLKSSQSPTKAEIACWFQRWIQEKKKQKPFAELGRRAYTRSLRGLGWRTWFTGGKVLYTVFL